MNRLINNNFENELSMFAKILSDKSTNYDNFFLYLKKLVLVSENDKISHEFNISKNNYGNGVREVFTRIQGVHRGDDKHGCMIDQTDVFRTSIFRKTLLEQLFSRQCSNLIFHKSEQTQK